MIYNPAMGFKRTLRIVFAFFLLLPVPALIAPFVSDDPLHWAYRVYHPFMYRYPLYTAHVLRSSETMQLLEDRPLPVQSLEVLSLMIKHW